MRCGKVHSVQMRNNKIALLMWLAFNIFLLGLIVVIWKETVNSGFIVRCFAFAGCVYAFSFCWNMLSTYVKDRDKIAGITDAKRAPVLNFIDALTEEVLNSTTFWLWLVPIYYWMFRIVALLLGWLKDGEWNTFNTCDAIPAFCRFESRAIGLNKIVNWIGVNDFGIFLLLLCGLCGWLAHKGRKQD